MKYIFVSDIFGKTAPLSHFARQFNAEHQIIDPYNGQLQAVVDEPLQYAHFVDKCDHDGYFQKLNSILTKVSESTTVIGFSAGGAAAWRSVAKVKNPHIKKLIAFYPSQIRHHLDVAAPIPCEIIFPRQEPHFDVYTVMEKVSTQHKITCKVSDYQHGFMNPLSAGFNSAGYQYFSQYLLA
ncbi:dienelactone hydrolase family protein [Pseudoalteromonas sp. ZZD1]|uniref:dienelactone hydrolase family protein n=1 Tax=Pseudoalteromonas sp. ZZD1 TaxID=3139395 RepID=UPI003BAD3332